jgi:hypothetical protein
LAARIGPAFRRDHLPLPASGDSSRVRASKFCTLLCAEPWPAICKGFARAAFMPFRGLVVDMYRDYPLHLSFADAVAFDLIELSIRNAENWASRESETKNGSWQGFLVCHIPKLIERLTRDSLVIRTGSGGVRSRPSVEVGTQPWVAAGRRLSASDRLLVQSAVGCLSPAQQRAIRLTVGWWPARSPWSRERVALYLDKSPADIDRLLDAASQDLRARLLSRLLH